MFITFEGIDYSGKSTQARLLHEYLKSKNIKSVLLREPGGTKISEKIREILLNKEHLEMYSLTEFMLFSASRAQLVREVIKPHLKKNIIVICDRYYDSSAAYQGFAGKVDLKKIFYVNNLVINGLEPNVTFFIDISPNLALRRSNNRGNLLDRIENKKISFYNKVYRGFKEIAKKNRKRFKVINGRKNVKDIHKQIVETINKKLKI